MLIDRDGGIHSLYRQIDGAKTKDIKARLADLALPDVDEERGQVETAAGDKQPDAKPDAETQEQKPEKEEEPLYFDRDRQDREWQESIIDAAIRAEQAERILGSSPPERQPDPSPVLLNALQDRHHAELGRFYTENTQARLALDFRLDEQYGGHEQDLRRDVTHLEDLLNNSGPIRLWWLKITGQVSRNAEEDLQDMHRTLENIEWRKREAEKALENEIAYNRQIIEARHGQERQQLQPDPVPEPAYEPVPAGTDEGPDTQEDPGPSLEY